MAGILDYLRNAGDGILSDLGLGGDDPGTQPQPQQQSTPALRADSSPLSLDGGPPKVATAPPPAAPNFWHDPERIADLSSFLGNIAGGKNFASGVANAVNADNDLRQQRYARQRQAALDARQAKTDDLQNQLLSQQVQTGRLKDLGNGMYYNLDTGKTVSISDKDFAQLAARESQTAQAKLGGGALTEDGISMVGDAMLRGDPTAARLLPSRGNSVDRQRVLNYMAARGATGDVLAQADAAFRAQTKATGDFATGQQGNTARSLNVSISHMNTLLDLGTALHNGDNNVVNDVKNRWESIFGDAAPTDFDSAKNIVADEIAKGIIGGNMTQQDREELSSNIRNARSPEQLKGTVKVFTSLLGGQLEGLRGQYERTTGRTDFNQKFLSGATRKALGIADDGSVTTPPAAPGQSAPPAGAGAPQTTPNGVKYQVIKPEGGTGGPDKVDTGRGTTNTFNANDLNSFPPQFREALAPLIGDPRAVAAKMQELDPYGIARGSGSADPGHQPPVKPLSPTPTGAPVPTATTAQPYRRLSRTQLRQLGQMSEGGQYQEAPSTTPYMGLAGVQPAGMDPLSMEEVSQLSPADQKKYWDALLSGPRLDTSDIEAQRKRLQGEVNATRAGFRRTKERLNDRADQNEQYARTADDSQPYDLENPINLVDYLVARARGRKYTPR